MSDWLSPHESDTQWAVFEANVQAYRQLSVGSQGLLLTAGSVLLSQSLRMPFLTIFVISMIVTWYVYFPVIFARTAIVDFHKFALGKNFDRTGHRVAGGPNYHPLSERDYGKLTNFRLRQAVYNELSVPGREPFRTVRVTRKKLDVMLPTLMTVAWIILVIDSFM